MAADSCSTVADCAAGATQVTCNGSIDSGLDTGCRSSFASGDRLSLKPLTSSDRLSLICSPVDEQQQSPMSSTSSFLMPTPTTEEMADDWSLMSDNKSEGGEAATGIEAQNGEYLITTGAFCLFVIASECSTKSLVTSRHYFCSAA